MKVRLLALGGLLAAVSICACNNNNDDNNMMVNSTDSMFVLKAGLSNTAEISASQLALVKSADTAIQHYASMMIADHTTAQSDLKNVATNYGLTPPDSVDAAHAQVAMQLSMMSGRAFDSMYIHQQVTDHQVSIQLFQTETAAGNNVNLKAFASGKLPNLQMHLDHANMIAANY